MLTVGVEVDGLDGAIGTHQVHQTGMGVVVYHHLVFECCDVLACYPWIQGFVFLRHLAILW